MRKIITLIIGLLLSTSLLAQDEGQLYNKGTLYVSPGTLMSATADFINDTTGSYHNDGIVLLKGDFANFGTAGYLQPGGLTRFEGTEVQHISGSRKVNYYNVLFNNDNAPFAFRLSDTMAIFGTADFTLGIVDNLDDEGTVIFEADADHTNTSDRSYVAGKVFKNGNDDFIYPVGKNGYYRPLASLLSLNGQRNFFGEYYLQNSDVLYDHDAAESGIVYIDDKEYWTVSEAAENNEGVLVRLKWRDVTTSNEILNLAQNGSNGYRLVVVHWDPVSNTWRSQGGVKDIAGQTVTSDTVTGYGVFALGVVRKATHEISGNVFNDANGMDDGQVNGEPLNQDLGLNAVLVNVDLGNVYAVAPVTPTSGHYVFSDVLDGKYMVLLTTAHPNIGDIPPPASLPDKWENTGEHIGAAAGDDGNPDGVLNNIIVDGASVRDVNFGIRIDSRNFFIPNGFTPNGDGENDVWKPYGNKVKEVYLMVYNQYGQKLFETRKVNEGWDGTYKGKRQPIGVYVYYAEVTFLDGEKVTQKGAINLIR